jgi:hypothetical protein
VEDLKVEPVDKKLRKYLSDWPRHVTRVNNRMHKPCWILVQMDEDDFWRLLDEAETSVTDDDKVNSCGG